MLNEANPHRQPFFQNHQSLYLVIDRIETIFSALWCKPSKTKIISSLLFLVISLRFSEEVEA